MCLEVGKRVFFPAQCLCLVYSSGGVPASQKQCNFVWIYRVKFYSLLIKFYSFTSRPVIPYKCLSHASKFRVFGMPVSTDSAITTRSKRRIVITGSTTSCSTTSPSRGAHISREIESLLIFLERNSKLRLLLTILKKFLWTL